MKEEKMDWKLVQALRVTVLMAVLLMMLSVPQTAKAETTGVVDVSDYMQLKTALETDAVIEINITNPDQTFWNGVSMGTSLIIDKRVSADGNWTIPKGVTVTNSYRDNSGHLYSFYGNLTIEGTWIQSGNPYVRGEIIVANGGKYVASNTSIVNNMTVKSGGTVTVGEGLIMRERLSLEAGARVVEDTTQISGQSARIMLCHAILQGDNAAVDVNVCSNDAYISSVFTGNSVLKGTLILNKGLVIMSGDIDITGTVSASSLGAFPDSSDKVVVKSGGKLILSDGSMSENSNLLIENGGILRGPESPRTLFVREGVLITLNGTLEVPWVLKILTTNPTIQGTGTIALGKEGSLSNGKDGIANTIKITGYAADNYSSASTGSGTTNNNPSTSTGSANTASIKNGSVVTVSGVKYTVVSTSKRTVQYTKPVTSKATMTIPATVKINGKAYKVTSVAANAFRNNSALKKITIGKNVTSIGKNAFYGCKKLKTAVIGTSVTTIGTSAFYKCTALTTITIPSKVTSIGAKAFSGDIKLKTIIIKTSKLTSKKIGSQAFKGIYSKATIKAPKSKLSSYKKILISKGVSSKAKFKKI